MTPEVGTTVFERYLLERVVVGDAHGAAFEAWDDRLDQRVIVRFLRGAYFTDERATANLLRLERSRAYVHPNIARLLEVFRGPQGPVAVSQFVEGPTLMSWRTSGHGSTLGQIADTLRQMVAGCRWIHQIAPVGNLSPSSVIVNSARIVLRAPYFFIGQELEADPQWTAPEQRATPTVELKQSDVHALGSLLGFLLAGRTVRPNVSLIAQGLPVSRGLDRAYLAATAPEPSLRPAGVDAFWKSVEHGLADAATWWPQGDEEVGAEAFAEDTQMDFGLPDFIDPRPGASVHTGGPVRDTTEVEIVTLDADDVVRIDETSTHEIRLHDTQENPQVPARRDLDLGSVHGDPENEDPATAGPESAQGQDDDDSLALELDIDIEDSDVVEVISIQAAEVAPSAVKLTEDADDTGTFLMVSDSAVFSPRALASVVPSVDEYDLLEGEDGLLPGSEARTLTFEHPTLSAPEEQRRHWLVYLALVMVVAATIAVVLVVSQALNKNDSEPMTPPPGDTGSAPVEARRVVTDDVASSPAASLEVAPAKTRPDVLRAPKVTQPKQRARSTAQPRSDVSGRAGSISRPQAPAKPAKASAAAKIAPSKVKVKPKPKVTGPAPPTKKPIVFTRKRRADYRCPPGMAKIARRKTIKLADGRRVRENEIFCVDRYEYPGRGKMPRTQIGLQAAKAACAARRRRLCTRTEWRAACGARYPYGGRYDPKRCNTVAGDGVARPIARAGSFRRCKSVWGTYDMVGNVAEWTRDGRVNGGSSVRDGRSASCYRSARRVGGSRKVGFRCCADPRKR